MTAPLAVPEVPDHRFPGLAGKTAVVVGGAGGGVGTACVALLARSGASVVVADRDAPRLEQLAAQFPEVVTTVTADVTTDQGIDGVDRVISAISPCALVNVVGGVTPGEVGHFLDLTVAQWQRSLEMNLTYAYMPNRRAPDVGCAADRLDCQPVSCRRTAGHALVLFLQRGP